MRTLFSALSLALLVTIAQGQENDVKGLLIEVPQHLDSRGVQRIKETFDNQKALHGAKLKVVFDFNPKNAPAESSDFATCMALAQYLLKQPNTATVAYVHDQVSGHLVLPALACREIVMSDRGRLGPALQGGQKAEKVVTTFYEEVADSRGRFRAPVLKLIDPNLEVYEAFLKGRTFISGEELKEKQKDPNFRPGDPLPVLRAGTTASYDAATARKFDLAIPQAIPTRQELLQMYQLPPTLKPDTMAARDPVGQQIDVNGAFTASHRETLQRMISRAKGAKVNTLVFRLSCGGTPQDSVDEANAFASYLRDLKDEEGQKLRTIAYVPGEAPDTATIIALACDDIVMWKGAVLGDFSRVASNKGVRDAVAALVKDRGAITPLLVEGMFDADLRILEATRVGGSHDPVFIRPSDEQAKDPLKWNTKDFKKANELLKITGETARDYKLVAQVLTTETPEQGLAKLYESYDLHNVPVASYDVWDDVAAFLRNPVVMIFLILLGGTCVIMELKYPGAALPGVVAALCFVLFFWSWWEESPLMLLAVLLFVLGLALIALEIFVIPGFGVVGVSGVILSIVGLALATGLKWPQNSQETMNLIGTFGLFGGTIVGSGILAVVLSLVLPYVPYFNRLMLKAATEMPDGGGTAADLVPPEVTGLLGAVGVADTPLRPAGKAKFGEEYVDVLAEGDFVMPGTPVQVIQIEGNRIVVKAI